MKILLLITLILALLIFNISKPSQSINFDINGCYIGAFVSWKTFPDGNPHRTTVRDIKEFEKQIGRKAAIITSYRAFSFNEEPYYFPHALYKTIKENGSVLMLTWEPRDWNPKHPKNYDVSLLPEIIDGKYDDYLDKWAEDIRDLDQTILLRFGAEMNIKNLSWSGANNGGGITDQFGDPDKADGPERYVAAYRYVHDRFIKAGVKNVLWVWSPIKYGQPFEPWNHYSNYYPGDDYVDIIAMDEYNWGSSQPWSQWRSFNETYWNFYSELTSLYPDKTLIIGEFASCEKGGCKAGWITEAFQDIKEKYPKIKAFVWFNEDNRGETVNKLLEDVDWRINSCTENILAAQEALRDNYFIETIHP